MNKAKETKEAGPIKGTLIYQPKGPAGEYAKWAINLYNGCSNGCEYCYNRRGVLSHAFGNEPKLAAPVFKLRSKYVSEYVMQYVTENGIDSPFDISEDVIYDMTVDAIYTILDKDMNKIGMDRLQKDGGIFMSFKCDPCDKDVYPYTEKVMMALMYNPRMPVTILTKNVDWLDDEGGFIYNDSTRARANLLTIGFTITGMDEMEVRLHLQPSASMPWNE